MSVFGDPELGRDLFHVGLVVPDLRAAIDQYSALFGLDWATVRPPQPRDVIVDGVTRTCELLATYSLQGPPHLELIEETSGSVWAADSCNLNHIGFWVQDLGAAVERFGALGLPAGVRDAGSAEKPTRFSYHRMGSGFWTELVSVDWEPSLDEWLHGCRQT